MTWFLAIVLLLIFLPVLFPDMILTPWRESDIASDFERMLDAIITGVCGTAIGIVIARLASPKLFGSFDQKLLARDSATARVRHWIGTMAVAGGLMGWQAMTTIGVLTGVIAIIISCVTKYWRSTLACNEWTVWVWLSVLLTTIFSASLDKRWLGSESISPVIGHLSAAIGVYFLATIWKFVQPEEIASCNDQDDP